MYPRYKYRRRTQLKRLAWIVLVLATLWTAVEVFFVRKALDHRAETPIELSSQRIFITALHWNNEPILRTHWNKAIYELVQVVGKDRVFVSLQEGGSFVDDTKGALRELDFYLGEIGIRRKVVIDDVLHTDILDHRPEDVEPGWIKAENGTLQLRRIPFLAKLRNQALEPLYELLEKGETFTKILFLNDVAFNTSQIKALLNTNGGQYAAACALDFAKPPAFYDTFALRDSEGHEAMMSRWPYFRGRESRQAMKKNQPIPVKSCWNGAVLMDAAPFYTAVDRFAFRGISDDLSLHHVEGSECCLIHADNPLSQSRGVFLNPAVRVGYNASAYGIVNPPGSAPWLNVVDIVRGSWENRIRRWFWTDYFVRSKIAGRLQKWASDGRRRSEAGADCLIDETQVVSWNGWAHL
nr:hypothetical protein B0A51_00340 [Rachicladosporium sp. CCFEE 5018]